MILTLKDCVEDYPKWREMVLRCRAHFDEQILADVAVLPIQENGETQIFDKHNRERIQLFLALSDDFCAEDKPLIRWLLRENGKCFEFGFDISKETAMAAFMLYKHMDWDDTLVLAACKFAYGSNELYTVDTEIALGFGLQETLDYLTQQNEPLCTAMAQEIRHYCGNMRLKPRAQFIDYFEQRRLGYLQEELARDYGLIDD